MKNSVVRFVVLVTFMEAVFAVRIMWEMEDLTMLTFLHQFFWFYFVALWFGAAFRIIGDIPWRKVILAAPASLVVFIPLLQAHFAGIELQMNYYQIETFQKTVFDVATLLFYHEHNSAMFLELLILLVGSFLFVYHFTKRVIRSLITAIVAFYGSFLIAGVSWFSVSKTQESLFYIPVGKIEPQLVYTIEFVLFSAVIATALVLFELKKRDA